MLAKQRLGKGLSALLPNDDDSVQKIPINNCRPNPYQPRKQFDADAIEELKISIEEYGIVQPLILRKSIKGYEIVAGERRFRAAKEAGLKEVPAIIKDLDDDQMMEIALLENLQREDLTIIEEAIAYKSLIEELTLTQEELSNKLGKSRSHIANTMRLLSLPNEIVDQINIGELSMGHGRALLGLKDSEDVSLLVDKIVKDQLNVRQVEKMVSDLNKRPKKQKTRGNTNNLYFKEYEDTLRNILGTKVSIQKGKNKGKIEIEFYNDDELGQLIKMLQKL